MLLSIFTCTYISFNYKKEYFFTYCIGIFNILLNNSLLRNIGLFRGYAFFDRGDMIYHLFEVLNISNFSHISINNFYPAAHIIGYSLYEICDFQITNIGILIDMPFSIAYICSMYIFAQK